MASKKGRLVLPLVAVKVAKIDTEHQNLLEGKRLFGTKNYKNSDLKMFTAKNAPKKGAVLSPPPSIEYLILPIPYFSGKRRRRKKHLRRESSFQGHSSIF